MAQITQSADTQAEWQTGTLDGVDATSAGDLVLDMLGEDFEVSHGMTDGGMAVSLSADHAASGAKSLLGSVSKEYSQRARPEIVERGDDFFLSCMVLTRSGYELSGLCGVCFGVPAEVGTLGYQVVLDVRDGSGFTSGFQLRRDSLSTNYLTGAEVTIVADTWYRIDVTWTSAGLITANLYDSNGDSITSISKTDNTYTAGKCGVCCYEPSHFDDFVLPLYTDSGQRTATAINLSTLGTASATSTLSWTATDNSQTVTIETAVSTDNGSTWSDWATATNGGSIPGITTGMDLSSAQLKCRQTLSTTDTSVTPQLHSLTITVREQSLISGVYTVGGEFVNRTVRAHRRSDGAMLAESTVSPTDGTYSFDVGSDEECYLVFIDTTVGTYQYVLAASLQTPYEVNGCSGDDEVQSAMIVDRVYGSGYDGT